MAYLCFTESEEYMNMEIGDKQIKMEDSNLIDESLPMNKFILACRQFQKGLSNMEILRF